MPICYLNGHGFAAYTISYTILKGCKGMKKRKTAQRFLSPHRLRLHLGLVLISFLIAGCLGTNQYPETPIGHFRLADQYFQAQDFEEAITIYERIVLLYGGTEHGEQANYEIARIYHYFLRDLDSAANYYNRVIYEGLETDWDHRSLYELAVMYEREIMDYSKAKLLYSRLLQGYPESEHRNEALTAINRIESLGY